MTRDYRRSTAILAVFSRAGSPCHVKKLLSENFKKANPSLPWSAMARMRDKLVHHYRGVDLKEIWKAAEVEIPKLLQFLDFARNDEGGG